MHIELMMGLGALGFAGLGTTLSIAGGVTQALFTVRRRKNEARTGEIEIIKTQLEEALNEHLYEELPHRVRYSIRCPSCGRFAKRVLGHDDIVDCKRHGVQVRWQDMPVDWALVPVTEGVTLVPELKVVDDLLAPTTGPIAIIVPDDLSDLIELGARI